MDCYRCGSKEHRKAGMNHGRQRYKCKHCGLYYSKKRENRYSTELRKCALRMAADGASFRQIERLIDVSHVTVMKWVRLYGEQLLKRAQKIDKSKYYQIIDLDELCNFIQQKRDAGGYGLLLIALPDTSAPANLAAVIHEDVF